ncbi:Zinc finger protein swm [Taenia solium]|eukprot:TsM_000924900 transcript=TsM_000924900 gene=TsM_000924900
MRVDKGALKSWLRTKIEALSITDLTPLYKYIVVLVTKDKPESELKAFCIEQLEELLGDKTADFVEEMFSVALTSSSTGDQVSSEKPHDDRSHRRAQGRYSPRPRSPHSNSPEIPSKYHRSRSPTDNPFDSNNLRAGSINSNSSRRLHNQNLPDSRRHHHEAHEYDPEDFNDRNTCHHRPRSDHSDQEDSESHRTRSSQRPERSRERGVRMERPRCGKPEDPELNRPQRRRCRNFDERGFCIYGDRCKYEHGSDALVIPGTTAAAWTAANLFDTALAASGTCLLPTAPSNGPSGLLDSGNDPLPTSSVEQDDNDGGGLPIYNPTPKALTRKPTHSFRSRSGAVNNKNIISIPTDNNAYEPSSTPPAYEPARPEIADDGASGSTHRRPTDEGAEQANPVPPANIASTVVTATDYTPSPISRQQQQCSLLVTKLPWRVNEPHRLREHFARFGNVVNIQTHFGGQNSQALVTYASVAEAEAAYRSPEPILSNRFIRLSLWPPSNGPLSATANGGGGVGRMAGGGSRFRGASYKRHVDALGFSQFGHSLLGDAQPISQRLPAKFRLGQIGDSVNFLKRGHLSSSNTTNTPATKSTPNNRSRWRLERDENGNPVSGDEDDDDDDEEEVVDVETVGNDGEANPRDDAEEELSKKRFRHPDFDDIDDSFVRNRNSRNSSGGIDEETSDLMAAALQRKKALWERQKSNALKEHQAKLAQFEKQRAARQQIEAEKRALIVQLSAELKETVTTLETVSNSETKRTLVAKAKGLFKRLEELRKSAKCSTKRGDEAKQQNAVQQLLPDSVAAERLEKISDVRQQLTELESRLQIERSVESQAEIRRKIADLKRRLVDLETIRPSDLAALNAATSLSIRGQTKLDKRPRVLYVTGHSTYDVEDFRQALAVNYLYTESFRPFICGNDKQPVIEITFCTRDFAEAAVRMFPQFHGRQLVMSFAPPASMTQEQQRRQREEIEVRAEGTKDGRTSGDAKMACDFSACALDEELSVPVVDATVGDEFRSPKVKASSSPRLC